jgi:putative aldouronate transport system permease protein
VQTVSYLPHFISWSITAGLLVTLLSPSTGIVNQILKLLNIESVYFLAEPSYTRSILVISSIWKGIGWGSIMYLAALTGISPELYEAARLDGAGKLRQVWHITLPGMSSIIVMQLIFFVTSFVDVGFEQVYNIVNQATYDTGMVISTFVYTMGIKNGQFSFTTAVGLAQSLVGMVLLFGANTMARRIKADGAIW